MILLTVLLLLSLLMAAGMGAAMSVRNNFRMTSSLRNGMAASSLADAGVEWGKQQIALATTMPPTLAGARHDMQPGAYTVSVLSSTQTNRLGARILLRSLGTISNASQSVQVMISKTYDLADGALALRGKARSINSVGSSFTVSGFDHDLINGAALPGKRPRIGVSVETFGLLNQVNDALDDSQKGNISGDDGRGAAIAASDRLGTPDVARIASELCAAPDAVVSMLPASGNLVVSNHTWGSRAVPGIRCVNGLPGSGDFVRFESHTGGAGILVVRDAEMVLTGDFRWEGLVIVSGDDVGLRVENAVHKDILGAVIIQESGNATGSGPALLDLQGSLRARFSREALNMLAVPLLPAATLTSSYHALPFALIQEYWRSIDP